MDIERVRAETRQRLFHAAARIEKRLALVGDFDPWDITIGKMGFQLIGMVMHIDDHGFDTGVRKAVENMINQSFAAQPHKRLRQIVG